VKRADKKRIVIAVGSILAVLAVLNFSLPAFILPRVNNYLAKFSDTYSLHIEGLTLNFLRMAYTFENVDGQMKQSHKPFLKIREVDVSVDWRELLHLRILSKVQVNDANAILTKALFEDSSRPNARPKEEAVNVRDTLFPVRVARVTLKDSKVSYSELIHQPELPLWKIRDINGYFTNVTPTEKRPLSDFNISGELLDNGKFSATGKVNRLMTPVDWATKAEVRNFHLKEANPALVSWVPVNFAAGTLSVWAEAHSQKGVVNGYLKPFFDHAKVFQRDQKFKNAKHFLFDVLTAAGNAILKRHDDKTVAAKVLFHSDKNGVKVDTGDTLKTAFEHGFEKPLARGWDEGPQPENSRK
jgi:hypothetical protein